MAIDFHKWKAEPSGMHSHAEHGNEENAFGSKVQGSKVPRGAGSSTGLVPSDLPNKLK